jgi:hypothetical protein
MNYLRQRFAVALMMIPLVAGAQAGIGSGLIAQVPFAFMVGDKVIPAGECVVQSAGVGAETIYIQNRDLKIGMFSYAVPVDNRANRGADALIFHKYGDRYFLSAILLEGNGRLYQLPRSKAEAEMRARNVPATEETLRPTL